MHCITNAVAQASTANTLLAVGAVPSMTIAPEEVGDFVKRAGALLVNLGTFDAERRAAAAIAIDAANELSLPWVLDPVFVDRSAPRAAYAKELAARAPKAMRLNRAEFVALAGCEPEAGALGGLCTRARHRGRADRCDRSRGGRHAPASQSPTAIR